MTASTLITIDPDVYAVLAGASITGNALALTGQLDRKLYERTNKVLEALGGKWNRKAKAHLFDGDPAVLVAEALEQGGVQDEVKQYQFYPTPEPVVNLMLDYLDLRTMSGKGRVLEPSAGQGAIAQRLRGWFDSVDVCELNPKMAAALGAQGFRVVATDFLAYEPDFSYDVIAANPPFTRGQDIDHAAHMLDLLCSGGRLGCILSAGATFRQDKRTTAFHQRLKAECDTYEIYTLPAGSFASSGTMVNAVLLIATKA